MTFRYNQEISVKIVFNEEYKFCKISNCVWGKQLSLPKMHFLPRKRNSNIPTLPFHRNIYNQKIVLGQTPLTRRIKHFLSHTD